MAAIKQQMKYVEIWSVKNLNNSCNCAGVIANQSLGLKILIKYEEEISELQQLGKHGIKWIAIQLAILEILCRTLATYKSFFFELPIFHW